MSNDCLEIKWLFLSAKLTPAQWQIWRAPTLHGSKKPEIHITFIILPPFQTTSSFQIDHSIKDIGLIPLELINSDRESIRKAREGFLISKGKTP